MMNRDKSRRSGNRSLAWLSLLALVLLLTSASFSIHQRTRATASQDETAAQTTNPPLPTASGQTSVGLQSPDEQGFELTPSRTTNEAEAEETTAAPAVTETLATSRPRRHDTVIPDGPSFAEIAPDGRVDYTSLPYSSVVPERPAVADDYFADALFIGNSVQQIQRQIGRLPATFLTAGDFNVYRYFEWELTTLTGEQMTAADYLESESFAKIYLTFGINEVSYENQERMWQGYRDLVSDVLNKQPQAIVYLQGVLPVYPPKMDDIARELITPEKILEFNHKLAILAEDEGIYMVNAASVMADEQGWLPADWSTDGVHFGQEATAVWDDYLTTHTVDGPA